MKIELHLLQNVAPACLNRDDTNTPKDCEFGGVRRARISSQCLKRAIRTSSLFQEEFKGKVGTRTRNLAEELAKRLHKADESKNQEDAKAIALRFISAAKLSESDKGGSKTKNLLHVGPEEIDRMVELLAEKYSVLLVAKQQSDEAKAKAKEQKKKTKSKKGIPQLQLRRKIRRQRPQEIMSNKTRRTL